MEIIPIAKLFLWQLITVSYVKILCIQQEPNLEVSSIKKNSQWIINNETTIALLENILDASILN